MIGKFSILNGWSLIFNIIYYFRPFKEVSINEFCDIRWRRPQHWVNFLEPEAIEIGTSKGWVKKNGEDEFGRFLGSQMLGEKQTKPMHVFS